MSRRPRSTEVDAYVFIRQNLEAVGWDVRNPERVPSGQVWTQNECLSNQEMSRHLEQRRPENIVKVSEGSLWVIEAKRTHGELSRALGEAEDYARLLNKSHRFQVHLISGVAGNSLDSFLIRTRLLVGNTFLPVTMNGIEATGLLSPNDCEALSTSGDANIQNPPVNEKLFLSRAQYINEILHLGAVNPHQRAGVMAALLLSMLSATGPNVDERAPDILINDVNGRVRNVLRNQGKEEFYDLIRISLPASPDNHLKFRKALVGTIQELNNLNIRSAMNSGVDWLGTFYEVFLKYANWAQDLGIVLTPRHVTRYVADVLDVQPNDIVYDPTCGTGGFLVAAFDYVKCRSDEKQTDTFKQNSLFGVEQDSAIAALAVVNMIFRGDGKNNIVEGDCFAKFLAPTTRQGIQTARYTPQAVMDPPVTKVMMNPPFALKRSDDKEYNFVNQALGQMAHGGVLFSILPYSAMVKQGQYAQWRRNVLLGEHTLLAVITFPDDLFYPIGTTTVGIFVRKGVPHSPDSPVLWVRTMTDGLEKSKGKRLPNPRASNDLEDVKDAIKAFIHNPRHAVRNVDQLIKATSIDFDSDQFELAPEVYLDQANPTLEAIRGGLENGMRNVLAYLVKIGRETLKAELLIQPTETTAEPTAWKRMKVTEIFDLQRGNFHALSALGPGPWPTISRVSTDNGFVGFFEKPDDDNIWPPGTITVATVSGDTFIQPLPFIVTDNVVLCTPKPQYHSVSLASLFFIRLMIDQVKWRWSYGRQCYKTKFSTTEIVLPATVTDEIDWAYMEDAVQNTSHWPLVEVAFTQCKECTDG